MLRNTHSSKWQWIFSHLRRCFRSSSTNKTFTGLENTRNMTGVI